MASFLDKIQRVKSRLLGTAAADIPTPFELRCHCGHRITGIRQSSAQQSTCGQCGEARFVLPANVYPATRSVKSEAVGQEVSERLAAAARELLPAAGELPARTAESPANDQPHGAETDSQTGRSVPTEPAADSKPRLNLPQIDLKRTAKRTFTPFRLIMLGALLAIAGTGGWLIHQQKLESARQNWRAATDEIEVALEKGRFDDLPGLLDTASQAVRILDRRDADAATVVNLKNQTEAVQRLSSLDLISELERVYSAAGRVQTDDVEASVALLTGTFQIFDCPLKIMGDRSDRVRLILPIAVNGDGIRIESESALLVLAAQKLSNISIVFAAKILSCRPPEASGEDWIIELDGRDCSLITTALHLEKLGLSVDNNSALLQRIEGQRSFIENAGLFELEEIDLLRIQQRTEREKQL
ncbi:MAG: hypothetical protein R3C20_22250 [Planctomycetaceae bacterium]